MEQKEKQVPEKNQDQSAKSVGGNRQNKIDGDDFRKWHDGHYNLYIGPELSFKYYEPILNGKAHREYSVQFDHIIATYLEKTRQVIVCCTDATTTVRNDRMHAKSSQGANMKKVSPLIKKYIIEEYPHVADCEFIFDACVTKPNQLNKELKNYSKEDRNFNRICVDINYKVAGRFITDLDKRGIDIATSTSDLLSALEELKSNQTDYDVIDNNTLSYIWAKQHNSIEFFPRLELVEKALMENRDTIIGLLSCDENLHFYTKPAKKGELDRVSVFLKEKGLLEYKRNSNEPKRLSMKEKRKLAIEYIVNNYPPETASILDDLAMMHKEFRDVQKS